MRTGTRARPGDWYLSATSMRRRTDAVELSGRISRVCGLSAAKPAYIRLFDLRRLAYAEDVVQPSLVKLYAAWPRAHRFGLDAYMRRNDQLGNPVHARCGTGSFAAQ